MEGAVRWPPALACSAAELAGAQLRGPLPAAGTRARAASALPWLVHPHQRLSRPEPPCCQQRYRHPAATQPFPPLPARWPPSHLPLPDLYALAKAKTCAHSIDISKDGAKFATFSEDR